MIGGELPNPLRCVPRYPALQGEHTVTAEQLVRRVLSFSRIIGFRESGFEQVTPTRQPHALVLELETLRTQRGNPRAGVDRVTWNVKGTIQWRSQLTDRFGIQIGGRVYTNLLVGEVPMLELKRSMIDEPMAMGTLGVYFDI